MHYADRSKTDVPGRRSQPARTPAPPRTQASFPGIQPLSPDTGQYIRWMLYAWPGVGKTALIATAAEAGMKTLIIRSPMDQVPARALKSGAEEFVVEHWEQMMGGDGILEYLQHSNHGYEWVWFDCMSIIQDVLLDDIWQSVIAEKPTRASLLPSGGLDRGEYWRNAEREQQWIRHMVGAKSFHFGITCHPQEGPHPTDDEAGTLLTPWIQVKNMPEKICGYCNLVSFMELKSNDTETWRRVHFRENERFYAKDLYDAFPKGYMDKPTIPRVMQAVEAARSGQSATTTAGRRPGRRGRREQ